MGDLDNELKRAVIAEVRRANLTWREIEERLGVTQTAVARLMSTRHVSRLTSVERLAHLVGKRIRFVLEDE